MRPDSSYASQWEVGANEGYDDRHTKNFCLIAMTAFTTPASVSVQSKLLKKPSSIYEYTHASATSLVKAFENAKAQRGNVRGVLTDQE